MSENKLMELINELLSRKEQFEYAYHELMDAMNALEDLMNDIEDTFFEDSPDTKEELQEKLNTALNKQNLVSQLREQLESSIAVEEPASEIVNENAEQEDGTEATTESISSQLDEVYEDSPTANGLVEVLRSQLNVQEEEEEEDLKEDWDEVTLHPLVDSLRKQIAEAELRSLPTFDGDNTVELPTDPSNFPNLSDVLRQQQEENSTPVEETVESTPVAESTLSLAEMIQQMRIDINSASEAENEKEEEELISAASSNSEVAVSLRQQLLVQELKKQLK